MDFFQIGFAARYFKVTEKMSENPLVSVIVVTYNRLNYLKLTIDSILSQNYQNFEIIIMGDGPQQDVFDYVIALGRKNIIYGFVQHCGYPARARNEGIDKAKGKYIAFCDDDDLWMPEKLEKQIQVMTADETCGFCFTSRKSINELGKEVNRRQIVWIPKKTSIWSLIITNYISYSSVILKKEILEKHRFSFRVVEDYHLWLRLVNHTKVIALTQKLIGYRVHSANRSNNLANGMLENIAMFKNLRKHYGFNWAKSQIGIFVCSFKFLCYKLLKR